MKTNVGIVDRIIRAVIAVILGVLYFTGILKGTLGIVLLIIGIVLLLTSILGFCVIYLPLGVSTCARKKDEEQEQS